MAMARTPPRFRSAASTVSSSRAAQSQRIPPDGRREVERALGNGKIRAAAHTGQPRAFGLDPRFLGGPELRQGGPALPLPPDVLPLFGADHAGLRRDVALGY